MGAFSRKDIANVALLIMTGVAVGVVTVAASVVVELRDRSKHRQWLRLGLPDTYSEDLPEELSETELAMEARHVAIQ